MTELAIPDNQQKEAEYAQIPKVETGQDNGRGIESDIRAVGSGSDLRHNYVAPVPRLSLVHPATHLASQSHVNPVPPKAVEPKRESGSTRRKNTGSTRPVNPVPQRDKPPTFTGYKWKPSGLTGWELYTRKPSISKSGGRSSTGKYLGYYSAEAVKVLYAATQKTANTRRA